MGLPFTYLVIGQNFDFVEELGGSFQWSGKTLNFVQGCDCSLIGWWFRFEVYLHLSFIDVILSLKVFGKQNKKLMSMFRKVDCY